MAERKACKTATRVVFLDTEVLTTMYYKNLYTKEFWSDLLYVEMARHQKYDLWIFLEPDVAWVDDGLRQNASDREKQYITLRRLLDSRSIKYELVGGNYQERYMKSLDLVNNLLL